MPNYITNLQSACAANNISTHLLPIADGQLLIQPHAARILACDLLSSGLARNLFYNHPDLESPQAAKSQFDGCVMAGDRLWIAPEIAYMWCDLDLARKDPLKHYHLNPDMDPGNYQITEQSTSHISLENELKLVDHRVKKNIHLRVQRQFDAYKKLPDLPQEIKSLSFTITNRLELIGGDEGALAGAWDILQVPAEPQGTLICPTTQPVATPRSYYDPFGDRHVQCDQQKVRFLIDANKRIKMGLAPTQTTGRMAYYQQHDNLSSLIVRIFNVQLEEPYCDLPRDSNERIGGDCLQAYNDDETYGRFGEMEYHDPALIVGQSCKSRQSTSVTHVLVGPDQAIRKIGQQILNVPIEPVNHDEDCCNESNEVQLNSVITCPECGFKKEETMPTNSCLIRYKCQKCETILTPRKGDCCVFCTYASLPCSSIQEQSDCCKS